MSQNELTPLLFKLLYNFFFFRSLRDSSVNVFSQRIADKIAELSPNNQVLYLGVIHYLRHVIMSRSPFSIIDATGGMSEQDL